MDDINSGTTFVVLVVLMLGASIDAAILAHKSSDHATSNQLKKISVNHARQLLLRQRRSATATDNKMLSNEFVLQGTESHTQAYVHWSGKQESMGVFILTLKFNSSGVGDSQTWRSLDYGTTYNKLTFSSDALVTYFFVSPVNHTKMVFTDVKNKRLYTSSNEMEDYENSTLPAASDNIRMHPTDSDKMLLYDYFQKQLWVTLDFGKKWTLLQSDVNPRIFWGVNSYEANIVHMEVQPKDSEQAYYMRCTIPHCDHRGDSIDYKLGPFMTDTMLLIKDYIFVQKANLDGTDTHMMVSYNRGHFGHTYFPDNVVTKDFLLLDGSEGQVFVAVNHGDREGVSLYLSDPTGRFYVLSLANVHHRSAAHWFQVDIHLVEGLNGVFMANQRMDGSSLTLKSLISFDKGGNWMDIPSPKPNCKSDSCALLLRLDNFVREWVLSEDKAPGFLIAHGHYGRQFDQDLNNMSVFVSSDGGYTWAESNLMGLYHFNILDQGSLVTAIKTGDQEVTNTIHYSSNEGKTWQQGSFSGKKLIVDGVLNEPGINTLVASVYGHENPLAPWTMIKLNFSQVLSRNCSEADYKNWEPSDHDLTYQENCILGQKWVYSRKKPDAQCRNGEDFVRPTINSTCTCEEEDFECDFGFTRLADQTCKKEAWFTDSYLPPECVEHHTYNKSKGYRRVGSDKCIGDVARYNPQPDVACPLVAPSHLNVVANASIVATGRPIHLHLSQRKGTVLNDTRYVWNFNGKKQAPLVGLAAAQSQIVNFTKPGVYLFNVTASNQRGENTSNTVRIRIEERVHTVAVFSAWATKVGFPVTVGTATNLKSKTDSSLHFIFGFGDEVKGAKENLTWESHVTHTYNKSGTYTLQVTAVNSVSAVTKQVVIKVVDTGVMLQLGFSSNVNRIVKRVNPSTLYSILESVRQEFALMFGIGLDRLSLTTRSTVPLTIDILILPRPAAAPTAEMSIDQIVQTFVGMVGNKTLILFRSLGLPKSYGQISVTSVEILKGPSGGGGGGGSSGDSNKKSGANYRAVYIAIPIVILAGIVTVLVLVYYRRRFRNVRRYTMVHQHEDTDALLDDDEDEPPLDLRPDTRDDSRRDDAMLDLGTGSHLVMVTGSGGGDGAENC